MSIVVPVALADSGTLEAVSSVVNNLHHIDRGDANSIVGGASIGTFTIVKGPYARECPLLWSSIDRNGSTVANGIGRLSAKRGQSGHSPIGDRNRRSAASQVQRRGLEVHFGQRRDVVVRAPVVSPCT